MNITLTDAECAEMNCDCQWDYHESDSCFVPVVEQILAARLTEQREQDEELARGNTKIALDTQRKLIATAIEAELPSADERGFATFTLWLDNGWTREQADELYDQIVEVVFDSKWSQGVFLSGSFSKIHDPFDSGIERAARIVRGWATHCACGSTEMFSATECHTCAGAS